MAECIGSVPCVVDELSWTNGKDSASKQNRSSIIRKIIIEKNMDQLRTILQSDWDINEVLNMYTDNDTLEPMELLSYVVINISDSVYLSEIVQLLLKHGASPNVVHRVNMGSFKAARLAHRTCLHEAVCRGFTEIVEMLLNAGAKCSVSDGLQQPLVLALQRTDCPPDLIELLLKHGADPNGHEEPNDDDDRKDQINNIPLLSAMVNRGHSMITNLLLQHGANPNVAYGKNIMFRESKRTALHEAVSRGWTDTVQLLIDAGADFKTFIASENSLTLALRNPQCPADLIEILLKHGTDPNSSRTFTLPPLSYAITRCSSNVHLSTIVRLLLEYGAKPHINHNIGRYTTNREIGSALQEAVLHGLTDVVRMLLEASAEFTRPATLEYLLAVALHDPNCPPDLIEVLLQYGADVTLIADSETFIHIMSHYTVYNHDPVFLRQQLDLYFLHGGDINRKDHNLETPLVCTVRDGGHANTVRWLIRHGADTLPTVTLLKVQFMRAFGRWFPSIPLILLQAGMRVPQGAQAQLSHLRTVLLALLPDDAATGTATNPPFCIDDASGDEDGSSRAKNVRMWRIPRRELQVLKKNWDQLEKAEQREFQRKQRNLATTQELCQRRCRQMADLQEFSDESLDVYPEVRRRGHTVQSVLDRIDRMLDFLSQPQSLQWYCRRCVRENLVSLQPSVVKSLPVPARLKRYILCHEI